LNIELFDQSQAIIDLNRRIVFQQQECTNAMSERENEIVAMIKGMKSSLTTRHIEYHSTSFDDSSGVAMMMKIRPEEDNTKTIEMLNKLESKIKKK
jgi:hypothetical protein